MIPVQVETLALPPVDRREVLRYAGAKGEIPGLTALLEETLAEVSPQVSGQVCWADFPVTQREDLLDLGFSQVRSKSLARNLAGCRRAVVFAATIGLGVDRLIARYGRISPAKALLVQAAGAERIEALCDTFCDKLRQETGLFPAPRFSPGYGDLPLALQSDIFRVLDCSRKIGLTLNDSLLMSPSKSVTAIVGLRSCPGGETGGGCAQCSLSGCPYRRLP